LPVGDTSIFVEAFTVTIRPLSNYYGSHRA
jgi:hypothetical protein